MSRKSTSSISIAACMLRRVALALVLAGTAAAASANPPAVRGNDSYLALGDSVVFGYITAGGFAYGNPDNFLGYPDYVGNDLRFRVDNAACPGETSSGFVDLSGDDNGCRPFRANFPLHVTYSATQLEYAVDYLKNHKHTRLVTIGIGANDAFRLQAACLGDNTCIQAGLPSLLGTVYVNLSTILANLRSTGYTGLIVVVNYYSLDYTDPVQTGFTQAINQTLAGAAATDNGTVVADAFDAFQTVATVAAGGSTCGAGLLNGAPSNATAASPAEWACDVHPSLSGQQLLAHVVEQTYVSAIRNLFRKKH